MKPKSAIKNLALATALGLAISFTAHAATVTKAPTGTDLTAGASWGGTVPTATDTATWTATSLGAGLTFGSDASWQGIAVTGAASAIDITGAGTLTLGAGGIDLAAVDLSIQNGIALGESQNWKTTTGRTLSVAGNVSGTGDLTIGTESSSQTSTTFLTLSNQTLFTNTPLASVVSVTGKMGGAWVNSGMPLNAAGYQFANNGTTATCWFKVADGGFTKGVKIELSQSGADIQARALQAKYISGTNFAFNFDTGGTVGTVATSQDAGGYGGHTTTINLTNPYTGTVSLSGTNSYDGATTVASGTLAVAGGNAIPDASALSISVGTSLLLNSSETVGSLAGAGTADLQGNTLTAGGDQSSTTFAGTLAGTGGSLVKAGTGTLTLTGTGSLTGGAVVSQGTLLLNNPTSLGTLGSVTLNDANTGAENAALIAQTTSTGDFVFTRPITVTNQGSGITTIGTNRTGAGRTFIDGEITLNKDVTLSGTLGDRTMYRGGIRGTGNVTINGGSRTTFGDDVAAQENSEGASIYDFTGNLTLTGTGTMLQYNSNIELTHVGTVTVETSATMRSAYGKSLSINALAGSGTVTSVAGSGTLVIGIANGGDTFSGVISGTGGDALKLAKAGSGTQILTGTNTYTGATTINGGTLKLGTGGSINGTTSITVAPGATFDAADTGFTLGAGKILSAGDSAPGNDVTGAVVSEGTIRPGGNGTLGTLTGITNLTLGGTLDWDRSANSTEADNIVINGTLTISPGFNLNPAAIGFPSAGTRTYTLVSGLTSPLTQTDIDNLPPPPADYTWDTSDPTALKISHVQVGSNLVWKGSAGGNWDTASPNWTGVPGIYQEGDFCTFDDTATGTTTIDIPADVNPGAVLFNHSTLNYTVGSNAGMGIAGAVTLVKQGAGTLTLTSSNIHTGGTTLSGGVLSFGLDAIPTTGPLTMDGGTLRWEPGNTQDISTVIAMVNGKTATFDTNGNDVVFTAGIGSTSTAALVKAGAGNLALAGTGTWSGGVEIREGSLVANTNGAFGGNTITLGTTAQDAAVIVANRSDIPNAITVSAAGTGAVTIGANNTGAGQNAASITGVITLNRPTTLFGGVTDDRLALDGRITGNVGTLTVTGGSRTTLSSILNDFTGNIVITGAGSVLQASVASDAGVIPDATHITIDAGAVFQTASTTATTETVGGISGSGQIRPYKDAFPGNVFGTSIAIGGGDQDGDFSGVITNGNGTLSVTKTGTGSQVLRGFNTYTGDTVVEAGELKLADDAALTFRVTNTTRNTLTGAGSVILDGNFAIDVSAVTATTGSWQLENADSLPGAYGSSFQVVTPGGDPWTDAGSNKWKYASGNLEFTFDEATGTLTVQLAGFASWISKAEYGLAPADQDPTDDPDNDGVNNLVEYAIDGRNPAVADGAPGSFASGILSFTKRTEAAADPKISYQIQESDDLGLTDLWAEAPAGPDYTNNATTISYKLPDGKAKIFARLVVTQAP